MKAVLALCILVAAARLANAQQQGHDSTQAEKDSAFRALQHRGRVAMGVDQYTSAHQFESLPNGGRIELQRLEADSAGVSQIRKHLKEIVLAFQGGDFRTPAAVHAMTVPGTEIMRDRKNVIRYEFGELPRGGEIRIVTTDAEAVAAVHDFLAFQRRDHRTGEPHRH
jgi:hypothetical protein